MGVHDAVSVLATLPDVVLVVDPMARIDFASAGSARYLGSRPRDWVGQSVLDRIHPDDVDGLAERLCLASKAMATPTQALPVRVSVGERKWRHVAAHGFVPIDVDGLVGTLVMFRDVTGRSTRESARQTALDIVFNRDGARSGVNGDDRTWITNDLIPQLLSDPESDGSAIAVIVMTLAGSCASSDSCDPHNVESPVGALAERLRKILRPADVLVRLGDGQLVVLCTGLDNCHDGVAVAHRLHEWCSLRPCATACLSSLRLTTGVAFASEGDDARAVLDFAASSKGHFESGCFALAAV